MSIEEDKRRYEAATHGMQSGVAFKMTCDPAETNPKHLRVGINSAMVEHAALAKLLVDKGVITWDEYWRSLADAMERERDLYREYLRVTLGAEIDLR